MLKKNRKNIKAKVVQKARRLAFVLQAAAAVLIYSCGGELQTARQDAAKSAHENVFGESGEKGLFRAYLTDFPIGNNEVTKVLVNIAKLEIHSDEMGWLTVAEYPDGRVYNLLDLQDGKTEDLGELSLEPGMYTQIRIILNSENQIEVDEGNGPELKPLTIPSGEQTGIKLVHPFEVPVQGVTSLTLDFNAQESVFKAGSSYKLKPTIKVIDAETTPGMSKLISAENGGDLVVLGKVEVNIPPGALSEDTRIEIVPKKAKDEPAMFNSFIQQEDIFDLQPDGLQFNKDVTISMNYDETAIAAAGLNENSATPFYYNEEGRFWQIMEGEVWENHNKVVFLTNHFTNFTIAVSGDQTLPSITPASVDPFNIVADNGETIGAPKSISATVAMPAIPENAGVTIDKMVAVYFDSYTIDEKVKYRRKEVLLNPGNTPGTYSADISFLADSNHFKELNDESSFFVYVKAVASNGKVACAPASTCPTSSQSLSELRTNKQVHEYVYDSDINGLDNTDPLNQNANGSTDLWEIYYEIASLDVDSDYDGKSNWEEYNAGTNPRLSDQTNMYWTARLNLLNRLVEVGTGKGKSLVASGVYRYYTRGDNGMAKKEDFMAWADTGVKHGWYLGVLATEHKRVRMASGYKKAEPTLHELYFALKAIERMDYNAELFHDKIHRESWVGSPDQERCLLREKYAEEPNFSKCDVSNHYWPTGKNSINGFIMRDDMLSSAYQDYFAKKPTWAGVPPRGSSESIPSEGTSISGGRNTETGKFVPAGQSFLAYEVSQDQYVHMYMGLALVIKYIPTFMKVNGESVRELAQKIENRIYHSFLGYNWTTNSYSVRHVVNPVTGKAVHTGADIFLGGIQLCLAHQYIQTGWYSHADRHTCRVKHAFIDWIGSTYFSETFSNNAMAMQLTSYSNYYDEKSFWWGKDNTFISLNGFEMDTVVITDSGEVKRDINGDPICTAAAANPSLTQWWDATSCKSLYNDVSPRWNMGLKRTYNEHKSDPYIAMFEWVRIPGIGKVDTWKDAEEVFGLVNLALYNKDGYHPYSRDQINAAMSRLKKKEYTCGLHENNTGCQQANEGKLEYMLMHNLYHLLYNDLGTTPTPHYVEELKRHLGRSQTKVDVNSLGWDWYMPWDGAY